MTAATQGQTQRVPNSAGTAPPRLNVPANACDCHHHIYDPPLPAGIAHPSHAIVLGLIDQGRAWVKLSGAYSNTKIGPPEYPDATKIAQAFVKAAPERLVWGSDWPHPGMPDDNKPDDAVLFDLLGVWAPDETTRHRILVENPEKLYGFPNTV
jgi:predicted TIM-barrel fold metal-dependent hydrolase